MATVINLNEARTTLALADVVTRYAQVTAQVKELEAQAKALRGDIFAALDANESDALEVAGYKVTRSARRSLQQDKALATLDAAGLSDCVVTTRQADQKAADAAVTLGLLDGAAWAACFSSTPVLTVKAR
jgi:uncharacterized protein involved in exopolysaccharide biosynthesis